MRYRGRKRIQERPKVRAGSEAIGPWKIVAYYKFLQTRHQANPAGKIGKVSSKAAAQSQRSKVWCYLPDECIKGIVEDQIGQVQHFKQFRVCNQPRKVVTCWAG